MITNRRGFIAGALGLIAAPAIVKIANIMPVRAVPTMLGPYEFGSLQRFGAQFRYVVLHDSHDGKALAGWDYGNVVSMRDGDTFTLALPDGHVTFNHDQRMVEKGEDVFLLV